MYVKAVSGKYYNTEALEGPNWTLFLDDNRPEELHWDCRQIPDDVNIFTYMREKYKLDLLPKDKMGDFLLKQDIKRFWKVYRRKDNFKRSITVRVVSPVPDEFVPKDVKPDDKPKMECVIIGGR